MEKGTKTNLNFITIIRIGLCFINKGRYKDAITKVMLYNDRGLFMRKKLKNQ